MAGVRKIVQKRVRRSGDGVNVMADVNAVVAASVGTKDSTTGVSKRQSVTIVQRNGTTEVTETESEA